MTPIFASNRASISGWYMYTQPEGRPVFWDGGGHSQRPATGFWCSGTRNIVDVSDTLVNNMPNVCLFGNVQGDRMTVTGFPRLRDLFPPEYFRDRVIEVQYFDIPERDRAPFVAEIAAADPALDGFNCDFVDVTQLPEDDNAALVQLRLMGGTVLARHPLSFSLLKRSPNLVTNLKPVCVEECTIKDIIMTRDEEYIDFVEVYDTFNKVIDVTPLYPGDEQHDCKLWDKRYLTIYTYGESVVGYE